MFKACLILISGCRGVSPGTLENPKTAHDYWSNSVDIVIQVFVGTVPFILMNGWNVNIRRMNKQIFITGVRSLYLLIIALFLMIFAPVAFNELYLLFVYKLFGLTCVVIENDATGTVTRTIDSIL